jgi:putative Holliday junction resolvase
MDSTEGYRAKRTREFAAMLEAETGITPVLFDERLTTSQAYVYMNEIDFKSKKRKGVIDALSAKIILQDYLDFTKGRG